MDADLLDDADLRALTVPRNNIGDFTLDDNLLDEHLPLDQGWDLHPRFSLGMLDRLPPEILCSVLLLVDLQSLTDFRRVNQRAMEVTDSIPQYAVIVKHAPDSIRALLAVEAAHATTCQNLYNVLCTSRCNGCGNFGDYLYLITLTRVCFNCFTRELDFLPLPSAKAWMLFGVTLEQLKFIPRIRSLPGYYSSSTISCKLRNTLYDGASLYNAGLIAHGSRENLMMSFRINTRAAQVSWYQDRVKDWRRRGRQGRQPTPPQNTSGPEHWSSKERFMAIIRFPYLNASTKKLEVGFRCKHCETMRATSVSQFRERRIFNVETFKEHSNTFKHV